MIVRRHMKLKLDGQFSGIEEDISYQLKEVCITASHQNLKKIGEYLIKASKYIEENDHWHLQSMVDNTNIVVSLPPKKLEDS